MPKPAITPESTQTTTAPSGWSDGRIAAVVEAAYLLDAVRR
jgi:hypothetical protein